MKIKEIEACKAQTKKGLPCKNKAINNVYCGIHSKAQPRGQKMKLRANMSYKIIKVKGYWYADVFGPLGSYVSTKRFKTRNAALDYVKENYAM